MVKKPEMQTAVIVALASCFAVVPGTIASGQTGGGTFSLDRSSIGSVREYVADDAAPRQLSIPRNLFVSSAFRRRVEMMLHRSPTFRRQCMRIGGEPLLAVKVDIARPPWRSGIRATTNITRRDSGHLMAHIGIFPLNDTIELIAHELEHVIEQLDEIDLHSRAALPGAGVHAVADSHAFETARAKKIGLKVAAEVRTFRQ
jgi:hypothetical protein